MNFQELNYILCIAKHRNLTKAAQELYVSQPTLSKHLKKMELELDGKLFSRSGNYYIPTYLGRRYMEYARKILEVNQDWERELKDISFSQKGELHVAFPLMRSSCMVPEIMAEFHEKYPQISVNFEEEAYDIQERLLLNDQLDFGIFNESRPHPKLTYEILLKEEILMVMRKDHPLAGKGKQRKDRRYPWMDLREIANEKVIMHFPEQTTGRLVQELMQEYGIDPEVPVRTRNTETSLKLCMQGIGICFVPEMYVHGVHLEEEPACFSVGETGIFSTLTIAYRKGAYFPAYAKDFIAIVKKCVDM